LDSEEEGEADIENWPSISKAHFKWSNLKNLSYKGEI
jgi:hypothetical protein